MTDRLKYRLFVAGAALMGGVLLAAPVWDFWHYRHMRDAAGRPAFGHAPFAVAGFAPVPERARPEAAPPVHGPSAAAPEVTAPAAQPAAAPVAPPAAEPASAAAATITGAPPARVSEAASIPTRASGEISQRSSKLTVEPRKGIPSSAPAAGPAQSPTAPGAPRTGSSEQTIPPLMLALGLAPATSPAPAPPPAAPEPEEPSQPPPGGAHGGTGDEDGTPQEDPPGPMTLWLEPVTRVVAPGQSVSVRVLIDAPQPVASVPFHVVYDPAVVQFVAARQGGAYAGTSLQPILIGGINPERPGDVAVGLSFVGTPASLGRPAEIVVLEFQGNGAGDSTLAFERASVRDTTGVSLSLLTRPSSISVR